MDKIELQTRREQLKNQIAELAGQRTPEATLLRVNIQAQLSTVNAQIKQLNIEEATRDKANADVKAKLGMLEHAANTARAVENAAPKPLPKSIPPNQRQHLTQGEYILINAKRVRDMILKIPKDARLNFTKDFFPLLEQFIAQQKLHVKQFNQARQEAALKVKVQSEAVPAAEQEKTWQKTWIETET